MQTFFSDTTYDSLQNQYVFHAVNNIYNAHKEPIILRAHKEESLDLLGDRRCNSPGYSAKYGTYTLMNSKSGEILYFNVIHVAQAGNSAKIELGSLKSLLTSSKSRNVTGSSLTTDRNLQVRPYMKKEKPNINHQFDIWHVG